MTKILVGNPACVAEVLKRPKEIQSLVDRVENGVCRDPNKSAPPCYIVAATAMLQVFRFPQPSGLKVVEISRLFTRTDGVRSANALQVRVATLSWQESAI